MSCSITIWLILSNQKANKAKTSYLGNFIWKSIWMNSAMSWTITHNWTKERRKWRKKKNKRNKQPKTKKKKRLKNRQPLRNLLLLIRRVTCSKLYSCKRSWSVSNRKERLVKTEKQVILWVNWRITDLIHFNYS